MSVKGIDNDLELPTITGGGATDGQWDRDLSWVLGWITTPGDVEIKQIPVGKYLLTISP